MHYFWTNTVWYILLGIITIVMLIAILKKTDHRKFTIAFYFSLSGVIFSFEAIICMLLKAYDYYPKIVLTSQYNDTISGNHFSQFSVAATALLIAVYGLRYYWYFIAAIIYGLIEELFLYLGIYKQYWYSTWYTVIGIIILCWVVGVLFHRHKGSMSSLIRYIYVLFALFAVYVPTVIYLFRLSGNLEYNSNILSDPVSSNMILVFIHLQILSNIVMLMYLAKLKLKWHALVIALIYTGYYLATKLYLIYIAPGWFWTFTSISIFVMYLYVFILNHLYTAVFKENY